MTEQVINPLTGRLIRKHLRTYNKLVNSGSITLNTKNTKCKEYDTEKLESLRKIWEGKLSKRNKIQLSLIVQNELKQLDLCFGLDEFQIEICLCISLEYIFMNNSLNICKRFVTLPNEIRNLYNLKYFDLNGNNIVELPSEIGKLSSLTILNLRNNQIRKLPPEIGCLTQLKELDLSDNVDLTYLPSTIGDLKSMVRLTIENGNISVLPVDIGRMTNLKELLLNGNNLKKLPNEIGLLESLEWLNVNENKLNYIPDSIGYLKELEFLGLFDNELTSIPLSIGNMKSLIEMQIGKNHLLNFPFHILMELGKLQLLDLRENSYKLKNEFASSGTLKIYY
jgi:Leucine-rich repeat (LRR) protein